ncbi:MAG TPA: LysR substrate-binding domain-containing protein [Solirubrobacteraceae bacterium]|nr:LysR substrate-binding domain-containing protein [Solirubrobacteraceae bacterium]
MELRHLRYFVAVAEEESFTRAAERLWIAQPGLSQQIRALERELGVELFVRLSRGGALTDAGHIFLDRARVAIAAADEALATARDARAGLIGHLRIGLSTQARGDLWPTLIGPFSTERPGVEITVREAQSDTLLRDLLDSRLDAAIVLGPVVAPGVHSRLLHEATAQVAMSPRHRLARHERICAGDLDGVVVAVSGERDGSIYDGRVSCILETLGVRHRLQASGYGPAMLTPVHAGSAIAVVASGSVDPGPRVVLRPLEQAPTFRFEVACSSRIASPVVDAFVASCMEAVEGRVSRRLVPVNLRQEALAA